MTLDQVIQFIEDNKDNEEAVRSIAKATTIEIKRYRAAKKGQAPQKTSKEIVKKSKEVASPSAVIKGIDVEASAIANELWRSIHERYPWKKSPKLEDWAGDIEKLHRIDKFDYGTIIAVMRWSQQDAFWCQNILSGNKLREKFDKLLIRTKKYVDDSRIETV